MPNIPETVVIFLACASVGAVWSCCSPDFTDSLIVGILDKQGDYRIVLFVVPREGTVLDEDLCRKNLNGAQTVTAPLSPAFAMLGASQRGGSKPIRLSAF